MEALLDASENQIAAFLVLLRAKGETSSEMAGLARAMQSRAVQVNAGDDVLDIVGTGGDSAGTVNISTGSCVLLAAARREGGETRKPLRVFSLRLRGRFGSARCGRGDWPRGYRKVRERSRHGFYVCPEIPPGDGESFAGEKIVKK